MKKILHISHHTGCLDDLEWVASSLGCSIDTLKYPYGYNIGKDLAKKSWGEYGELINSYDLIITSDTAPLSRVILDNYSEFKSKLIIWICNRFDYADQATNLVNFPDSEYYSVLIKSLELPNIKIIPYTDFEAIYFKNKTGYVLKEETIRPSGMVIKYPTESGIPSTVIKSETVFIPPYHNDTYFVNMLEKCNLLGIKAYQGRYNKSKDILGFKCVVHIPYAWSNLALFQFIKLGIVIVIPSKEFFEKLRLTHSNFFWSPPYYSELLTVSEWYSDSLRDAFVFFNSWEELPLAIEQASKKSITEAFKDYENKILILWKKQFKDLGII
jgi:hypothetical protein